MTKLRNEAIFKHKKGEQITKTIRSFVWPRVSSMSQRHCATIAKDTQKKKWIVW